MGVFYCLITKPLDTYVKLGGIEEYPKGSTATHLGYIRPISIFPGPPPGNLFLTANFQAAVCVYVFPRFPRGGWLFRCLAMTGFAMRYKISVYGYIY